MESAWGSGLPAVPIKARCSCTAKRTLPVWLVSDTLTEIRAALMGVIAPDCPVLTYRCRVCKDIVVLRARDLYLTDAEAIELPEVSENGRGRHRADTAAGRRES